jgi:protein TonB
MTTATITSFDRLGLTLFFATVAHAVIILGVTFTMGNARILPPDRTLEIMVVQNRTSDKESKDADFLAQTSQQGSGKEEEVVRPKTQTPIPTQKSSEKPMGENRPASIPAEPELPTERPVIATQQASRKASVAPATPRPKPAKRLNTSELIASSDQEIARLTAELDREMAAYASRPRRKGISAATREYKYANYLDAWKRKVERVGNLNYPDEAKRKKLYGNLVLRVSLNPDGTISEVQVRKSSGHKLLDDAAIRIVKLAAPYAPFPTEIREETDILDITRTWQFLSNNRLRSK